MSMSKEEGKGVDKRWKKWEMEVDKFTKSLEYYPPATTIRHWQRFLMFIFKQELFKNVHNETESIESIMERIIQALQVACGFKRVRIYSIIESDEVRIVLKLMHLSKDHGRFKQGLELDAKFGTDDSVDTLKTREPLIIDDPTGLRLTYGWKIKKARRPYTAIPLFVGERPYGLICADMVSSKSTRKKSTEIHYIEYKEHFETFARTIMAAIENRKIFEQRNQKILQFQLVKQLNEQIEAETDKEKLLNSFIEYCVKLVKADGGHIKLYNKEKGELERVADYGADVAPSHITSKPSGVGFSNKVFDTREALLINDVTKHPIMKAHEKFCRERKYDEYLKILEHRK